jgi:pimeloyl-ACP methyl ester carboxylesterase
VCSAPDNEEQLQMWNEGCQWAEGRRQHMQEVSIENDGLKLYGEYYDFGSDKCVIVLPGRCECLMYSYYFAAPYEKAGYNVLVIDSRSHGKSDGTYSTIGRKESRDVIEWGKFIRDNFGIKRICLHCICVGSASGIMALTAKDCPEEFKELVTEGCFTTFRETFKQHMIVDKRPLFPVLDLVMLLIYLHTGTNVIACSPLRKIKKVRARVMFLHSELDIFSRPPQVKKLFERCGSSDKRLIWFDKGAHSHIRINNKEKYDNSILEFLS